MNTVERIVQAHRSEPRLWAHPATQDYPGASPASAARTGAIAAMAQGQTHYVDVGGVNELRQSVSRFLASLGLRADPDQEVMVTAGEQEARFLAIHALTRDGTSLALPAVVHPGALRATALRRLQPYLIPVDEHYQITAAGIKAALDAGARVFYVESPSRLSGATLDAATIEAFAMLLPQYDATLICDLGLAPFADAQAGISTLAQLRERMVVGGTPWPGFGAESWLIGYLAGPPAVINRVRQLKQVIAICTCAPAQYGIAHSEEAYAAEHTDRLARYRELRDRAAALAGAAAILGESVAALAVRVPNGSEAVARLQAAGFAADDGAAFSAPGVVRLAVDADGAVVEAVRLLSEEAS